MKKNGANPGTESRPQSDSHEEFLELCALFASDSLTEDEHNRLERHLHVCAVCSDALKDYERIAGIVLPTLGPDLLAGLNAAPVLGSTESAKRKLLERARSENVFFAGLRDSSDVNNRFVLAARAVPIWHARSVFSLWRREPLLRYAAGILLVVGLTVSAYRLGERKAVVLSHSDEVRGSGEQSLQQQVAALTREGQTLAVKLRERDQVVSSLASQMNVQVVDIAKLKEKEKNLQRVIQKAEETKNQVASERDDINQQLKSAQNTLDDVSQKLGLADATFMRTQDELNHLRQQRETDFIGAASLEARIAELSKLLKGRDDAIAQQQQLLSADRDIRELMGARDLYLAEVYDVARNGENEKPFGRVFFTKNKSLIFYAYDLDQQPGVTNANAFQAWGRRGPDHKKTVSLGIFYMDNVANKRWVLKVDDPQTLQQIDSVFVTVEPKGGSPEPSRNKLLFAYLRVPPNHP